MNTDQKPLFTENDIVSSYTATQAIEDGLIIPTTDIDPVMAKQAGFKWPVRITNNLYHTIKPPKGSTQDLKGRLWDVLFLAYIAVKRSPDDETGPIEYHVKIGRKVERLWLCIDGTDGTPAIHIMHPEDY